MEFCYSCWEKAVMAEAKTRPARKSSQRQESKQESRRAVKAPKPVILRTGERATFRRCRQKWWWAWREGLTPPFAANSLWFGEGIHFALAEYYKVGKKRGPHPAETFEAWVGDERRRIYTQPNVNVDETEVVDAKDLGVAMLENYVEHYGKDPAFDVLMVEESVQHPITLGGSLLGIKLPQQLLYGISYDAVIRSRDDGKPWLVEHKTASSISVNHLPLDDQAGSYWATATAVLRRLGKIGPNEALEGIIYNFLRKAKPDERPVNAEGMRLNKDGSVSKQQPAPYFQREPVYRFPGEIKTQIQRIKDEASEMALVKAGVLPVTKNPTHACWWDCPFFQMCQLHEAGDDWESFRDSVFAVADPYEKHRKSAAE